MLKSLISALVLGTFAMIGTYSHTLAQSGYPRPCIKAPKDYLPCPSNITVRAPQVSKPRM